MLELLIMRHAKSDWGIGVGSDVERPLAPRGVKAAKRMGRFLAKIGATPDLVLSSPAVRARTTAELAKRSGRWNAPVEIESSFYGGSCAEVIDIIRSTGDSAGRVLVAGHEPTWSDLVSVLTGGGAVSMPTAAVACIRLDGDAWSRCGPGCGELEWLVTPKVIKPVSPR